MPRPSSLCTTHHQLSKGDVLNGFFFLHLLEFALKVLSDSTTETEIPSQRLWHPLSLTPQKKTSVRQKTALKSTVYQSAFIPLLSSTGIPLSNVTLERAAVESVRRNSFNTAIHFHCSKTRGEERGQKWPQIQFCKTLIGNISAIGAEAKREAKTFLTSNTDFHKALSYT